MNLTLGTSLL